MYKTFIGQKSLRVTFDETDGFIRIYDKIRYLVLLGPEKCDAIYKSSVSLKSCITYIFLSLFCKNQIWYWKSNRILTLHRVMILIFCHSIIMLKFGEK